MNRRETVAALVLPRQRAVVIRFLRPRALLSSICGSFRGSEGSCGELQDMASLDDIAQDPCVLQCWLLWSGYSSSDIQFCVGTNAGNEVRMCLRIVFLRVEASAKPCPKACPWRMAICRLLLISCFALLRFTLWPFTKSFLVRTGCIGANALVDGLHQPRGWHRRQRKCQGRGGGDSHGFVLRVALHVRGTLASGS